MIYFVPAWYKKNMWCENEQSWYSRRLYSEFDETIKQIQLFQRNLNLEYRILVLGYAPNLRHFLHRQGLFRAPYWSCFDAIQQVRRLRITILSFHDLKWPEGIEFVYSPFAVVAYLNGEKYATVRFGEDGNMISVDMFENGELHRRNYYDDRGFVSTTILYKNGKTEHQDFLAEDGTWRIRMFFDDGRVLVNPAHPNYLINMGNDGEIAEYTYKSEKYESLESVIKEVLDKYLENVNNNDVFFAATHALHMNILSGSLKGRKIISTFFENRFDYEKLLKYREFLTGSRWIITDSKKTSELVKQKLGIGNVKDISPYDARVDLGISQQLKVQNIMIPVDGINPEELEKIIVQVSKYLLTNDKARVHIFSRSTEWNYGNKLLKMITGILERNGFDTGWVTGAGTGFAGNAAEKGAENGKANISENITEEEEIPEQKFFADCSIDERNISKCVNEQRIILDMRKCMDVFLFITALSKGVPRLSASKDEFILDRRTGSLVNHFEEIPELLSYYLDSMVNWNNALVENYELGKKYSVEILTDAWKEVLGEVE